MRQILMDFCAMRMVVCTGLLGCMTAVAQQAPIPAPNGLPGHPYAIKKTWVIGGTGNWDTLTLDASAGLLYIAHGQTVQVVDIGTGHVVGTVGGFREAHAIALDDTGSLAYVTDGPANEVRVFDRRTYRMTSVIRTGPNPRALVLDPATNLLFVVCASQTGAAPEDQSQTAAGRRGVRPPPERPAPAVSFSTVTVIDTEKLEPLADLWLPGRLGLAQADGAGQLYVAVEDRDQVLRLNTGSIATAIRSLHQPEDEQTQRTAASHVETPVLDLRGVSGPAETRPFWIRLGRDCSTPRALAIDQQDARLFVACDNQKMQVIDAERGGVIAEFTIGPGAGALAWDAARGLIYTSNGGGYGSLTVIRRDVTDSYAEIQNLPTLQQARTMALNPSTGEVYLVTTLYGANLKNPPANGLGTLKLNPVSGSFQVLVVGN